MIGRLHHLAIDCPEPLELARFYSTLLGKPITYESDNWVVVADNDHTSGLAFQRALGHQRPQWPDPTRPQQMHLDVMVDDLDAAESAVLELGAKKHEHQPGSTFRVFLDPAGHPFCLCVS